MSLAVIVIGGQENCGESAASLGQHIKLDAGGGVMNGQHAGTSLESLFVFVAVSGVEVAPIAAHMTVYGVANVIGTGKMALHKLGCPTIELLQSRKRVLGRNL
jgi:hypothetical protein